MSKFEIQGKGLANAIKSMAKSDTKIHLIVVGNGRKEISCIRT